MYKIDLHTHSVASGDGSLKIEDYRRMIKTGRLDYIAITDHNTIRYAKEAKKILKERIIIGEEILTQSGEIIGLYIKNEIQAGLSLVDTINAITKQSGIVYIPHPFDQLRHGLTKEQILSVIDKVDIIECYNSRSLKLINGRGIKFWAKENNLSYAASSDAHGKFGFGKTKTYVKLQPTRDNIVELLIAPQYNSHFAGIIARFYPTINRYLRIKND